METQLKLIPASEHPTALESQWLNAISPADLSIIIRTLMF